LRGLDFNIKPGEKVALIGPSGSGKSTIINLLMRFYPVSQGSLKIDGKNIYDFNLSAFRKNLGIVPQEVILFGGTIRENIAYGKPGSSDAEIREAARKANAFEFIESFPEKFETLVGERGVKLSGGQRQRIAIARAILKDPAILILDEATSSLDAQSEVLVQQALETLMENRTSIIIAHRLSTIKKVDRIFVIKEGSLAETGSHAELTLLDNGIYSNLLKLQLQ
jgi:ABC-type multidrug transport system fused ATPase/permease subunit